MNPRYQIIGEINQGGVGVVLKAWDTRLSRHVAIKRFLSREQLATLGNVEGDLMKEASTLSSMQHPNIVSVFDVDMDAASGPEVIMEYLNGQDLEQAVAQAALTLEDFYQVAQQTLDALSNAHRLNLLHRDIKPSNIQVTWLANGKFVSKFVDFGLAKFFEKPCKQTVRQDGTVMGSVYYMAPEQFERHALDHRSDIYSLGCVFYYALTMHRPFEGATVTEVINAHLNGRPGRIRDFRPNMPPELEKWVEWLMNRLPDSRPGDAEIALTALRQIMAGQIPAAVPGIRTASQPVKTAPMRTGDVRLPGAAAFTATADRAPLVPAKPKATPAKPAAAAPARKKSTGTRVHPLVIAGTAAVVAIGAYLVFSGNGTNRSIAKQPTRPSTAADVLNSAKREAELHQTKAELAAVQARLAISQASPAKTALAPSSPPSGLSEPPAGDLVMWFDASRGTQADANGTVSIANGPVGQWHDNAASGGTAVFQYTASATPNKEAHFPTLRTMPPGAGLIAGHPVIAFDGTGDTLCIRDRDKTGDAVANTLDGGSVTVLMLFRAAGPDAPEGLLTARTSQRQLLWSLGIKDRGLVAGPGDFKPLQIPGTEDEFRIASLVMDGTAGSLYCGLISSDGQKATSRRDVKPDPAARLDMLRMGTSDGSDGQGRSVLAADVAEVLIYNRALAPETRHLAENYLRLKYFGSNRPTVTVNSTK